MRRAALALILSAAPVLAQTPMTAEEFDAYVTGKTLTYAVNGEVYGVETYLPGRRVIWAFTGDTCQDGIWFQDGPHICFDYGAETPLQCWIFTRTATGLQAQFAGDDGPPLSEVQQTDAPLGCQFEGVGV